MLQLSKREIRHVFAFRFNFLWKLEWFIYWTTIYAAMSNEDVENYIRQNVVWADLPHNIQQILGNSLREYGKRVLDVSIKNQLRHKGNIGEFVY
jgi:hypothetical protein